MEKNCAKLEIAPTVFLKKRGRDSFRKGGRGGFALKMAGKGKDDLGPLCPKKAAGKQ